MDLLHTLLEHHKTELEYKQNKSIQKSVDRTQEMESLKKMLLECQDKLDEETHKNISL